MYKGKTPQTIDMISVADCLHVLSTRRRRSGRYCHRIYRKMMFHLITTKSCDWAGLHKQVYWKEASTTCVKIFIVEYDLQTVTCICTCYLVHKPRFLWNLYRIQVKPAGIPWGKQTHCMAQAHMLWNPWVRRLQFSWRTCQDRYCHLESQISVLCHEFREESSQLESFSKYPEEALTDNDSSKPHHK